MPLWDSCKEQDSCASRRGRRFGTTGPFSVKGVLGSEELARCRAAFDWAVENHGPNAVRCSPVPKSYPERVQRLLGWSYTPETFMGWVEIDGEMADPIRLLS